MVRPQKHSDLKTVILGCIESGRYLDSYHSSERQLERQITRPEILYVLKNGRHEKRKDQFDEFYEAWNYSVRGKTLDDRELRIVISFDENGMLIITAIDLSR
jgi:hypothetical protein